MRKVILDFESMHKDGLNQKSHKELMKKWARDDRKAFKRFHLKGRPKWVKDE